MDQGTILSEFQKEIEEIKRAALESEKAIEEENSRRKLNSNFQDQIFPHEEQERIFNMSSSSDMDDIPKQELKSNDYEVKNNVVVEVKELRSMEPSRFSVDLNENFDSSVVCVDSVVRDCALPPIDKKNEKEEIIVDYVQSVPSFTSIIQLPPQSQLELV
ncbi:hypothetical protein PIB30_073743 [Stylosanthes scabra]|uniref:Uncharacterized protein n=1 Tax=Stylosanthes scabra TaxID=79078 RepID=A0ABU6VPH7_9FABA|nr:hypothetical protein [Stylosanthes scabra]